MKKLDQASVIAELQSLRPEFDFSLFVYDGVRTPGVAICTKHGEFKTTLHKIRRGCTCPVCANESRGSTFRLSPAAYLARAAKVHGDRFDYSQVDWSVGSPSTTLAKIRCKKHDLTFEMTMYSHLTSKHGCPVCAVEATKSKQRMTQADFESRIRERFGDKLDVTETKYVNYTTDVTVVCKEHGPFTIKPAVLMTAKCACKLCAARAAGEAKRGDPTSYIRKFKDVHGDTYSYNSVFTKKWKILRNLHVQATR